MTGLLLVKAIGLVLLLGGSYLVLEALIHMDRPRHSKRRAYR